VIVPAYDLMSSQADRCKATFVAERASKAGLENGSYGQSTLYPFVDEKEIVAWKVQLVGLRTSINDAAIIFKSLILTLRLLARC